MKKNRFAPRTTPLDKTGRPPEISLVDCGGGLYIGHDRVTGIEHWVLALSAGSARREIIKSRK